ncbi:MULTISPECIES: bifunctional riboflavin kinase/FAD synthetase [Halocynthiibacter]|uniref:Riboflavin biosynthesis protein n=1 Tax=Halocynthiibacter halioticoli TaxID=2986804 RepID=A0AAE3LUD0_9RHOB|nr:MULTISPECIES: bifunctional riboflavin kinase/FAD synthetase [Halocynthiibacter]MCV6823695.1 bifunctional riboflavin kinase/FAD synthetase [Halocynthiibacter halioticoli]MCW4056696.1 bifunctional riboflavin kinase/FAD synthetase [Halocynthiibacter sp. SDUM655004]
MRIYRDYQFLAPADRGASIAIGNFDGVHKGHQKVIDIARNAAPDCPLGILTFEPHPRQYFAPKAPAFRLMNAEAKAHRLEKLGVERLYELSFNDTLSNLTAREFAEVILAENLGVKHVTVGADFCFGKNRGGNVQDLIAFGRELGFDVTIAELMHDAGEEVSSSAIRQALSEGRPRDAARMLGHHHRIEGPVIRGDQRGRDLGYPTANMSITGLHPPKFGVYVVLVEILTGPHKGQYRGAASMGVRPMFGENLPNLESYIFDFKGDIYGENLSVALVEYLRPEVKFENVEALITQMNKDCQEAQNILDALETP